MNSTTKGSVRLERIASAIVHEINQVLMQEMDDKRLKHALIQRAEVSKDLSQAKVYFTTADPTINQQELAKLLNNVAGVFRHRLANTLTLRVTPAIKFYFDEQAAKAQRLLELMDKI